MENLQKDEVVISESGVQWASLLPHVLLTFMTGIWIVVLIYVAICRSKTRLTLTNKRLVCKIGGLFTSDFLDVPLNKVSSVMVINSALGKILGYATINVASSSGACSYDYVKGGNEFRNAVNNQLNIYEEECIRKQAAAMARTIK